MEYNPVAINEALAYSFAISSGSGESNRFFVELVNTLSQSALGLLPADDFGAGITNPPDVSILDLSLANYDLVMTADDPVSRPDPFTGQLLPISSAKYYAQLPLNQAKLGRNESVVHPGAHSPGFRRRAAYATLLGRGARQPARGSRLPDQPDPLLLRDRQPAGLGHGDSSH